MSMTTYQIAIAFSVIASLIGIYLLRTRALKSLIMAIASGVLVLLCGAFHRLIAQQEILWDLVIIRKDTEFSMPSPTLIQYIVDVGGRIRGYSQALEFTFWVLLIFVLIAPFLISLRRELSKI